VKPHLLRVSIAEKGRGFDPAANDVNTSTGLSSMKERVTLAGGRFNVQSSPGEGTLVLVEFDLNGKE
jgi:signal transduction histidine kinase